jgi:hypothetical protein
MSASAPPQIEVNANEARLAEHAALLEKWLTAGRRVPIMWSTEHFARTVELVRTHLRPLASSQSLGLSYSREHFQTLAVGPAPSSSSLMSRNATEVAYAIRWLELVGGRALGPWPELMGASRPA